MLEVMRKEGMRMEVYVPLFKEAVRAAGLKNKPSKVLVVKENKISKLGNRG